MRDVAHEIDLTSTDRYWPALGIRKKISSEVQFRVEQKIDWTISFALRGSVAGMRDAVRIHGGHEARIRSNRTVGR